MPINYMVFERGDPRDFSFPKKFYAYIEDNIPLLLWEWRLCPRYHNFGYPFAMDANVYNKEKLLQGLNFEFHTNTQLEGIYCQHVEHFSKYMSCALSCHCRYYKKNC